MFGHIRELLKKKEVLLQHKEPLFFDVDEFLKNKHPQLKNSIKPITFSNGVLSVKAESSVALQEFFLIKSDLLGFLQKKKHLIRDIITRLR